MEKSGNEEYKAMITLEPVCFKCKHFDQETSTCPAFEGDIPGDSLNGINDHKKSFEGDHGIMFEPIEE
jgi:hypothetical protein